MLVHELVEMLSQFDDEAEVELSALSRHGEYGGYVYEIDLEVEGRLVLEQLDYH